MINSALPKSGFCLTNLIVRDGHSTFLEESNFTLMSVGLFLSASGARVTFHAGVIDGLRKLGFEFDRIVGASGGGIQAVLTTFGCNGKIWFDQGIPLVQHRLLLRPPILEESLQYIFKEDFLKKYDGAINLEELNRKVTILVSRRFFQATSFNSFQSLADLQEKLLASSSIPYFVSWPIKINQKNYADGIFGYFYRRLDFGKILNTDLSIASLVLPTNHKSKSNGTPTFVFNLKKGKFNPSNLMTIDFDEAQRFYEDGYEQVMKSEISQYLPVK